MPSEYRSTAVSSRAQGSEERVFVLRASGHRKTPKSIRSEPRQEMFGASPTEMSYQTIRDRFCTACRLVRTSSRDKHSADYSLQRNLVRAKHLGARNGLRSHALLQRDCETARQKCPGI